MDETSGVVDGAPTRFRRPSGGRYLTSMWMKPAGASMWKTTTCVPAVLFLVRSASRDEAIPTGRGLRPHRSRTPLFPCFIWSRSSVANTHNDNPVPAQCADAWIYSAMTAIPWL